MVQIHDDNDSEDIRAEDLGQAGQDQLAELEAKLEEANNKALYAAAEVQNVRRRLEAEKVSAAAYASTGFARDMLAVKDHLERALSHVPAGIEGDEQLKNFVEGIAATLRELETVFARNGIERIEAKGQPLDPNKHQAMIELPSNEVQPGTIVEEMQAGYMIKDRLLRPALVGVAKA